MVCVHELFTHCQLFRQMFILRDKTSSLLHVLMASPASIVSLCCPTVAIYKIQNKLQFNFDIQLIVDFFLNCQATAHNNVL